MHGINVMSTYLPPSIWITPPDDYIDSPLPDLSLHSDSDTNLDKMVDELGEVDEIEVDFDPYDDSHQNDLVLRKSHIIGFKWELGPVSLWISSVLHG